MLSEDKALKLFDSFNLIPKKLSPILHYSEHIATLVQQLLLFSQQGIKPKPPYFKEECTPPLHQVIQPFLSVLEKWDKDSMQAQVVLNDLFAQTALNHFLLLMGQRLTPASRTDESAIPPLKSQLKKSFNSLHKHTLSVGARAWSKHANRSDQSFWGEVIGNDVHKSKIAESILHDFLDNYTWWNTFEHYKHGVVYEIRLPSGHGARWSATGESFIGFLEPFIEE